MMLCLFCPVQSVIVIHSMALATFIYIDNGVFVFSISIFRYAHNPVVLSIFFGFHYALVLRSFLNAYG